MTNSRSGGAGRKGRKQRRGKRRNGVVPARLEGEDALELDGSSSSTEMQAQLQPSDETREWVEQDHEWRHSSESGLGDGIDDQQSENTAAPAGADEHRGQERFEHSDPQDELLAVLETAEQSGSSKRGGFLSRWRRNRPVPVPDDEQALSGESVANLAAGGDALESDQPQPVDETLSTAPVDDTADTEDLLAPVEDTVVEDVVVPVDDTARVEEDLPEPGQPSTLGHVDEGPVAVSNEALPEQTSEGAGAPEAGTVDKQDVERTSKAGFAFWRRKREQAQEHSAETVQETELASATDDITPEEGTPSTSTERDDLVPGDGISSESESVEVELAPGQEAVPRGEARKLFQSRRRKRGIGSELAAQPESEHQDVSFDTSTTVADAELAQPEPPTEADMADAGSAGPVESDAPVTRPRRRLFSRRKPGEEDLGSGQDNEDATDGQNGELPDGETGVLFVEHVGHDGVLETVEPDQLANVGAALVPDQAGDLERDTELDHLDVVDFDLGAASLDGEYCYGAEGAKGVKAVDTKSWLRNLLVLATVFSAGIGIGVTASRELDGPAGATLVTPSTSFVQTFGLDGAVLGSIAPGHPVLLGDIKLCLASKGSVLVQAVELVKHSETTKIENFTILPPALDARVERAMDGSFGPYIGSIEENGFVPDLSLVGSSSAGCGGNKPGYNLVMQISTTDEVGTANGLRIKYLSEGKVRTVVYEDFKFQICTTQRCPALR